MRSRSPESERHVQSNSGCEYDDGGYNGALAVTGVVPPKELGKDETGFYPLDE